MARSQAVRTIASLVYRPMGKAIVALAASYSGRELQIIEEFLTKASEILERETKALRK